MAMYSAKIKYKFGSGRATTSTEVATSQLKGKSESAVMEFLREKQVPEEPQNHNRED